MRRLEYLTAFLIGALGYGAMELAFRGNTHWTMLLTGGACLLIFHLIFRERPASLTVKCLAACGIITALEFGVGCIVNLALRLGVWDYSGQLLNIHGQICLLFSALWFLMGIPMALCSVWLRSVFLKLEHHGE